MSLEYSSSVERAEKVERFEEQISETLDTKKAQILKEKILEEVKGDLSVDLRLTRGDLQQVYGYLAGPNADLFNDLSIDSFESFMDFIGMQGSYMTELIDADELQLFGETVEIVMPFGVNRRSFKNYKAALEQVGACEVLQGRVDASTKFVARGHVRLEFSVGRGKRAENYMATPDGVYRIDGGFTSAGTGLLQRDLFDVNRGLKVVETVPDDEGDYSFSHYFYDEAGNLVGDVDYSVFFKEMTRDFDEDGNDKDVKIFTTGHLESHVFVDEQGRKISEKYVDDELLTKSVRDGDQELLYGVNDEAILGVEYGEDGVPKYKFIFTNEGEEIGSYDYMQKYNPEMSEFEYMTLLAEKLDTPEELALFMETMMHYVHDDTGKLQPGEAQVMAAETALESAKGTEYWQLARETIHRMKDGCMLGDCDDYAFFAKEILKMQGKNAHVVYIPGVDAGHATCVWFEKNKFGNWDAWSIGTFGLDKNGNRYGMLPDPEKENGYPTLEGALNSLMEKFDYSGLGLDDGSGGYRLKKGKVTILDVPKAGERDYVRDLPVQFLLEPMLVSLWKDAGELASSGEFAKAMESYENMIKHYPSVSIHAHAAILDTIDLVRDREARKGFYQEYIGKFPDIVEYKKDYVDTIVSGYRDLEEVAEAEAVLEDLLANSKTDSKIYAQLNGIYRLKNDYQAQVNLLEMARENLEEFTFVDQLAAAYRNLGQKEEGVALYEELIGVNPQDLSLKLSYITFVGEDDLQEGIDLCARFLSEDPDNPALHYQAAAVYEQMIRNEEGGGRVPRDYEEYLKNPVLYDFFIRRKEHLEQALHANSEDPRVYWALESICEMQGLFGEAETVMLMSVIRLNKDLQSGYYRKAAEMYARHGRWDKVYAFFEKVEKSSDAGEINFSVYADFLDMFEEKGDEEMVRKITEKLK